MAAPSAPAASTYGDPRTRALAVTSGPGQRRWRKPWMYAAIAAVALLLVGVGVAVTRPQKSASSVVPAPIVTSFGPSTSTSGSEYKVTWSSDGEKPGDTYSVTYDGKTQSDLAGVYQAIVPVQSNPKPVLVQRVRDGVKSAVTEKKP